MVRPIYAVIPVDAFQPDRVESMGSKQKHWFWRRETARRSRFDERWLFKFAREGTGEDWAEKIACELAGVLELPHAGVELASFQGWRGCIVKSILRSQVSEVLVHGNELLYEHDPTYPKEERSPSTHTVERVIQTLDADGIDPPRVAGASHTVPALKTASAWLVGYLLLDAWIGNTDRHHENWAIIQARAEPELAPPRMLAPTFDHGSSLGRELQDEDRRRRLEAGWETQGVVYADRARSGLYKSQKDKKPVHPLYAFTLAAAYKRPAAQLFLDRLRAVADSSIEEIIARVPQERMSLRAKQFALLLLHYNRARLLEVAL